MFERLAYLTLFTVAIVGGLLTLYVAVYEAHYGAGIAHFALVAVATLLAYVSATTLVSSSYSLT